MNFSQRTQVGLDFFEFLKETNRSSITDRLQLRDVYNNEFRSRSPGSKDPNFGSILYALKSSGKVKRRGDTIRFNAQVQALYLDQWHTSRTPRTQGASPSAPPEPGADQAGGAPDGAETGVRGRRKLARVLLDRLKTNRDTFISDKKGVSVTSDKQFVDGKLELCELNQYEYSVDLRVKNTGTQAVYFTYYTPLRWLRHLNLTDQHKVTRTNPLKIQPGDSYTINVQFRCSSVGFYPATLAFEFKADLQSDTSFHIVRDIQAKCVTALWQELAPTAPYKPLPLPAWSPEVSTFIVDGEKPDGLSVNQLKNVLELKKYGVPPYMLAFLKTLKQPAHASDKRRAVLEEPLSWATYTEKFHLLLYLEELQMKTDIKRYNIPNDEKNEHAPMTRDKANKKLLVLEVPGVSENRPSVLRGDHLLVRPCGETKEKYRGYVHNVELNRVKLGFGSELLNRFYEGMTFSVEFTINQLTMRLQHRAAELATEHRLEKVLFPESPPSSVQTAELPELKLFNRTLEQNPEQLLAVRHIVASSSKPAPYLVFGPPGTGKTVTLVEAIKQIDKRSEASCHILACAPSNSAADLLCSKILEHVDDFKVHRMYASSRDPKMVPERLKGCSNLVGDSYVFLAKEKLMEFRIMVTTLLTAGRLVTGGVPAGHYTHVFVDEAGHALETECLVALAGLVEPHTGQVVLAGDPKQLGPILRSPLAQSHGMKVSLLERLMTDVPIYQKQEVDDGGEDKQEVFDRRFVTKLLKNYRSHRDILHIPNELFYDGELVCAGDQFLTSSYCSWIHLKQPDFPLIFHGVTGEDEREDTSPSFFNRAEVVVLMSYVRLLLETGGKRGVASLKPADIGIIAPYRKQVQKIRKALNKEEEKMNFRNLSTLKVGSVEEFQGQERRVILVSTVRSSSDYTDADKHFNLGFVSNQKRFNVAVTRAKSLLIVVGNPVVLNTDPVWERFISFCCERGGYDGVRSGDILMEEQADVENKLVALLEQMKTGEDTEESAVQQQLDPEWRNEM